MRHTLALACAALLLTAPSAMAADACATLARQVDDAGQGAVFVASYPTATDKALKNVAFLYDNAAAALALIGCSDTPHAGGDFDHDRFWKDGRLRNGYLAGPVGNPAKLGGWQAGANWAEDGYQAGSDTGNLAWAMLALLGLHRSGAGDKCLRGALRIAAYVERSFAAPGFTGGTFGGEPKPQVNSWKSTEHNIDLAAAFARLAPEDFPYRHDEEGPDDMPSHIKGALTAVSIGVPVRDGKLALGTWQGLYLFEHRHIAHRREVLLHVIGE